ncbi:MAG: RecQ family ATP-dependent DNA helicase [Gammaproteobacteria bacterium]
MAKKKLQKKATSKKKRAKSKTVVRSAKAAKTPTKKKRVNKLTPEVAENPFVGLTIRDCKRVAKSIFRIGQLHDEQVTAMRAVLKGNDTIAVLPTGFGKSLIYQTLACIIERPVITISPLIALMRDQEISLQRAGVNVIRVDSTLGKRAREEALAKLKSGGQLIVLTTPESLESKDVRTALRKSPPALLTVDEAHCISEWGHDFRPAYLGLGTVRKKLGNPPALALTATATARVQQDIIERLQMLKPKTIAAPPYRSNLRFDVRNVPGSIKLSVAGKLIRKLRRPGIIYCATTKAVDEIYGALRKAGIPATRYHGKMTKNEREREQKEYSRRRTRKVMVATSAFGMGIDKPNIRYILHYQIPGSVEQYVQEAGRAGRDGRPANCILLYDSADLDIQKRLITKGHVNVRQLESIGDALAAWADAKEAVSVEDLALSAAVQKSTCRALCHRLEEAGLVSKDEHGKLTVKVSSKSLRVKIAALAEQFQIVQRGDLKRLNLMAEYAESSSCRSAYLNHCFGELTDVQCGVCDRCRARSGRARSR